MSKRPCVAPKAVVHHTGVVAHIAHCLASTKDVLSLLEALPRHALDAPLAALQTLLTTPETLRVVARYWPRACIEEFDGGDTVTVLAALPIFRSISIERLQKLHDVLRDASSEPATTLYAATIDFASKWGHKVASIDNIVLRESDDMDALPRTLRLCTGLDSIDVSIDTSDAASVASILHAAQHVKRITLSAHSDNGYDCGDWRPLFADWLASGHATHLCLDRLMCDDTVGFVRAIAAATSLTSLHLDNASRLMQGLVDAATPLKAITQLRLCVPHDDIFAEPFVSSLVNSSALRTLELDTLSENGPEVDLSFVLTLLPRLVVLEKLSIETCVLRAEPALLVAPAPRHLRTLNVQYCVIQDDDMWLGLFHWTSQSPCLTTVTLNFCNLVSNKPALFAGYLRQWITGGVTSVDLVNCDLNEKSVIAIATALCHTHRTSSSTFRLWLDFDPLLVGLNSYQVLFEALATCTGVKIEVFQDRSLERERITELTSALHLRLEAIDTQRIIVYSP
ncbi:hypothetical protein SDRG_07048 [Saprolegnia diclina VS20]|uniref:F-box domain-containing protein n=1 Tax=Saprolegnia diclina (strain VS20) TaxID=1156394 RepID=T0QKU5_SAPDV|nr:hypothetical protein SDRG_07048 [Saprolegnia diclina VS20]EQC35336.1 hypothetical protein SDRG_07048 [Saprolegnia diclina VS20]|eukprot:XP_008611086.1 hypothetical protein SDRG_07048 [Saprolegnia diclina VS20]